MSGRPLKLGLVGCGRLAEAGYVPALARAAGAEVVAVADPDVSRAETVGAALGIAGEHRFAGVESMLTSQRAALEAVLVASPVATHAEVAARVAAAGLPALVEKPPAEDASGARALAGLDPAPRIAFNRRFSLGRDLAGGGLAGAELEIEATIHYRRESWRPLGDLGDAWLDLGPHLVDLALLAAQRPLTVVSASLESSRATVDLAGDGVVARIDCATDRPHRERLRVRAEGRTAVDARAGGVRGLLPRPGRVHPLVASLAEQLDAFAASRNGGGGEGRPRPASAAEAVTVMELIDEARA